MDALKLVAPRARTLARWLGLAALLSAFGLAPAVHAAMARINSDALYLAAMYRDLFVDRVGLAGWSPQPATSLFPDAPVFFVLRALLGHPGLAVGAHAAVVVLTMALLATDLGRQAGVAPWSRRLAATAGACSIGLGAMYERMFDYAIYPAHHGASLVVGMGVLTLAAREIRAHRPRVGVLVGIAILTGATAAFDRIFLLWCAVPIAGAVLCCAGFGVVRFARCAWIAAAVGLGAAGSMLGSAIERGLGLNTPLVAPRLDVSWSALTREASLLGEYEWHPTVMAVVLACAIVTVSLATAVAIGAVRRRIGRGYRVDASSGATRVRVLIAAAALLSMCVTLIGVAWSGMVQDQWAIRYLQPAYVIPGIALPFALALARHARLRIAGITLVMAFVIRTQARPRSPEAREEVALRPPTVACIDAIAARTDVRFGYASYWHARKTTELSLAHVRLLALTADAQIYTWISNPRWAVDLPGQSTHFVVLTEGLNDGAVRARFGEPREVVTCPSGPIVWIYERSPRPAPVL